MQDHLCDSTTNFPALLERLKQHVEHGGSIEETDIMLACRQPAALAHVCILLGNLSRFRNARVGGKPTGAPTHEAKAFKRADTLAAGICRGMHIALHRG